MRKFLFILLAIVIFGCSKDSFNMDQYIVEHYLKPYQEYIQSFRIKDTTGLVITNFGDIQGDPASLMFSGIRNGKLWIGIFNKDSKEQTYEWNDMEYLLQSRDKYAADGSVQFITIKYALIDGPVTKIGDTYVFIVYSGSNFVYTNPFTTDFYDLYFLTGDKATKYKGPEICTKIQLWYPGTVLTQGYPWCCFSIAGEKLYSFHEGVHAGTPITAEECINASLAGLKRVNLKTGEVKWQTGKLYKDLPGNSQIMIYKESEDGTEWTWKLSVLDGMSIKETRIFNINIETGAISYQ